MVPIIEVMLRCGYKNGDLTLSERHWSCPGCGALNDRDLNAALNLEKAGFQFPGQDVEVA